MCRSLVNVVEKEKSATQSPLNLLVQIRDKIETHYRFISQSSNQLVRMPKNLQTFVRRIEQLQTSSLSPDFLNPNNNENLENILQSISHDTIHEFTQRRGYEGLISFIVRHDRLPVLKTTTAADPKDLEEWVYACQWKLLCECLSKNLNKPNIIRKEEVIFFSSFLLYFIFFSSFLIFFFLPEYVSNHPTMSFKTKTL